MLSVIISFSGKPQEKKWPEWLSPEIRDRIGVFRNVLLLPPLGRTEAEEFIRDLLSFFRPSGVGHDSPFFPFTEESTNEVFKIMKAKKIELKPRAIMQAFSAVLDEADRKIESGEMRVVTGTLVKSILKGETIRDIEV